MAVALERRRSRGPLVEVSTRLRRTVRLGACVDVPAHGTARGRVTAGVGSAVRPCSGTEHAPAVGEELVAAADSAAHDVRHRGGGGWHHREHTFV